jgi:RNA polymerase sigma-70 factor (sigma-E family)
MSDRMEASPVEFYRTVYPKLVGTLALDSGDVLLAEEVAQEALTRLCERWSTVSDLRSVESWVFRVAYNVQASRFRRLAVERRLRQRRVGDSTNAAEYASAEAVEVRHAVADLPARQRQAIVLRYYADLSVAQTADVMGCKTGTVKALTSQAIQSLRVRIGDIDDEEASDD